MADQFEQIGGDIARVVGDLLSAMRTQLGSVGLTAERHELEIAVADPDRYTSELRVYVLQADDVVDVLEFHVFEKGKEVVTRADIEAWLPAQIENVIDLARQRGTGG